MTIHCFAPAKIILGGEHAVVYGKPAIALPIDRGVTLKVLQGDGEGPALYVKGLGNFQIVRPDPNGEGPLLLRQFLARFVTLFGEGVRQLEFHVDGNVPGGSGLGSSAALAVALVRGVHEVFRETLSDDDVSKYAMELETIFHGKASGVDHSVIAHGRPIYFCRGEAQELSIKVPLHFVVVLTGTHAGTREMVEGLRQRVIGAPEKYQEIFDKIEQIVLAMRESVVCGNLRRLGELMNANQACLKELGVSTKELDRLCQVASENGALGAKLTGAGGGGAVIALVDNESDKLKKAFESLGCENFVTISR